MNDVNEMLYRVSVDRNQKNSVMAQESDSLAAFRRKSVKQAKNLSESAIPSVQKAETPI